MIKPETEEAKIVEDVFTREATQSEGKKLNEASN